MASNSLNVKNNYKRIVHIDSHLPTQDPKLTTDAVAMICLDDFKKEKMVRLKFGQKVIYLE